MVLPLSSFSVFTYSEVNCGLLPCPTMATRDAFHHIVRIALQKDGWTVTHDPYPLPAGSLTLAIDLGAEQIIAADRGSQKIAVEIKSFLGQSRISEFYGALGQFITYRAALEIQEKERVLYLAVPSDIFGEFLVMPFIRSLIEQNHVFLLIYDIDQEAIERWLPQWM